MLIPQLDYHNFRANTSSYMLKLCCLKTFLFCPERLTHFLLVVSSYLCKFLLYWTETTYLESSWYQSPSLYVLCLGQWKFNQYLQNICSTSILSSFMCLCWAQILLEWISKWMTKFSCIVALAFLKKFPKAKLLFNFLFLLREIIASIKFFCIK